MEQEKPKSIVTTVKLFLIEKKNQRIFLLAISFVCLLVIILGLLTLSFIRSSKQVKRNESKSTVVNVPTETPALPSPNTEEIQEAGYSIDCQITVTTNLRKLSIQRANQCGNALDYKISASKKYLGYLLYDNKKVAKLFIYSLDNNVAALFQIINQPIMDYRFDQDNNILILLNKKDAVSPQTATYYFNMLLFNEYPKNYYKALQTFINLDKRKVDLSLPQISDVYTKIVQQQNELDLINGQGKILYVIKTTDLIAQLTPTPPVAVDKTKLVWDKRILLFRNGQFITMDPNGTNEVTHQLVCDGIEVVPIQYDRGLFSRSPDGKILAFLAPTEDQMRNDPAWKEDILAKKKVFDQGEIVLYDLTKDQCQRTAIAQTIHFGENFSFSPNGFYLAFVNKGIGLYNIQTSQDNQLIVHNPDNQSDATAVTGPLIWDSDSKFIYTTVSKMQGLNPTTAKLVRVYFDDQFNGSEQPLVDLPAVGTVYAVSPDGNKILYKQDQTIYKYDLASQKSSLFRTDPAVSTVTKLVWLRDNTIVSNLWIGNEGLQFSTIPAALAFQIDYGGGLLFYDPADQNKTGQIDLYDLNLRKIVLYKDKRTVTGDLLNLFY